MKFEEVKILNVKADGGNYMGYEGKIDIGDIIVTDKDNVNEILKKTFPNAQLTDLHTIDERTIISNHNGEYGATFGNDKIMVRIEPDEDSDYGIDPFEDPVIDIFTSLKRYNSPKTIDISTDDFAGWDEMKQYIIEEYNPIAILPISAYIHSGVSIFEGSANGWDSGQIGFGWITKEEARRDNITKDKAEEKIRNYIKYMDNIYRGAIYSVFIYDLQNESGKYDFLLDSCGNFVGDNLKENGILDFIQERIDDEEKLKGLFDDVDDLIL
jgi:hypothetical protein